MTNTFIEYKLVKTKLLLNFPNFSKCQLEILNNVGFLK